LGYLADDGRDEIPQTRHVVQADDQIEAVDQRMQRRRGTRTGEPTVSVEYLCRRTFDLEAEAQPFREALAISAKRLALMSPY
jgi:hypothetical protein